MSMKKIWIFLLLLTCVSSAQTVIGNQPIQNVYIAPSGSCSSTQPIEQLVPNGTLYSCQNGTWAQVTGGGGSGLPTATTLGQVPASTGAGTTYAAQSKTIIDVRDYGAVPDGSTDNSTAITNAFTAADAVTTGLPTVYFGCNAAAASCQYNYGGSGTSPINPTIPMTIQCGPRTTLNYTGTAHVIDLGPSGLGSNAGQRQPYTIDGCRFIGGGSATQGIWVNAFIPDTNFNNLVFFNFGNTASTFWQVNFSSGNNWSIRWTGGSVIEDDGSGRNFMNASGTADNATVVSGLTMWCLANACGTYTEGVGIWAGANAVITNNVLQDHSPIIRIASTPATLNPVIQNNWFELLGNPASPIITFGNPGDSGSTISGVTVTGNYFNCSTSSGISCIDATTGTGDHLAFSQFRDNDWSGTDGSATWINSHGSNNIYTGLYPGRVAVGQPAPARLFTAASNIAANWYAESGPGAYYLISPGITTLSTDWLIFSTTGETDFNVSTTGFHRVNNVVKWHEDTNGLTSNVTGIGVNFPNHTISDTAATIFGATATATYAQCETSGAPTTLSTGGTTTNTGLNCLPANSVIDAVVYRITTTITTASSFTIGDSATAGRFCASQSTLTAGTTGTCMVQWTSATAGTMGQVSAASVRVTTNVNPGAGAIRLIVFYHTWTPPTS
jgi:hypothetical protein